MSARKKFYLIVGLLLILAVAAALGLQLLRNSAPAPIPGGAHYQAAITLDQAGDLYHARQELALAMTEPGSEALAKKFAEDLKSRRAKADGGVEELNALLLNPALSRRQAMYLNLRGQLHELMGLDEEAMRDYLHSISLQSTQTLGFIHLGLLFERQNQISKALPYFKKAQEGPDSAYLSRFHLGMFYARTRQDVAAARALADELAPHRPLYTQLIINQLESPHEPKP